MSVLLSWIACTGAGVAPPEPAPVEVPVVEAPATEPATPEAPTDIAYYSTVALTPADLENKSLRELALMRNTIYARVGNPFNKKWLHDHFAGQAWYHPRDKADLSRLSEDDRANARLIGDREANYPKERLREEKAVLIEMGHQDPTSIIELQLMSAALGEYAGDPSVPTERRSPLEDPTVLDRDLRPEQLANLSRRDLRLARNLIFARRGRTFESPSLQAYFGNMVWYTPDPAYSEARLTDVDKRNVAAILTRENTLGGMLTEEEQAQEELLMAQA